MKKILLLIFTICATLLCGSCKETDAEKKVSESTSVNDSPVMTHHYNEKGCYITNHSAIPDDYRYVSMNSQIIINSITEMEEQYNSISKDFSNLIVIKAKKLESTSFYQHDGTIEGTDGNLYDKLTAYTRTTVEVIDVLSSNLSAETSVLPSTLDIVEYYFYKPDENSETGKFDYLIYLANVFLKENEEYILYLYQNDSGIEYTIGPTDFKVVIPDAWNVYAVFATGAAEAENGNTANESDHLPATFSHITADVLKKYTK